MSQIITDCKKIMLKCELEDEKGKAKIKQTKEDEKCIA